MKGGTIKKGMQTYTHICVDRERGLIHWFTLQIPSTVRTQSSKSQEPRAAAWSAMWMLGTQALEP